MKQYQNLISNILDNGTKKEDRTGVGTVSLFGEQLKFDLSKGFPLLTTKRVPFKMVATELLWFLKGDTNIKYLLENNNNIWNEWAISNWFKSDDYKGPNMTNFGIRSLEDEEFNKEYQEQLAIFKDRILNDEVFSLKYGELGKVYGSQWRNWEGRDGLFIDQIMWVINEIIDNPTSRRLIVNAWNIEDVILDTRGLPPCHYSFQFYVNDNKLSCLFNMRSTDVFLGLPFNIASYALLTHLIARECGLGVGELVFSGADVHIYNNHFEQCDELLSREPKRLPNIHLMNKDKSIFEMEFEDFYLENYHPHPTIKAPVAV